MYKLTFKLKQHTPLIHFQHNHAGATLRATELKPKLDKFLLKKLGGKEAVRKKHPDWFLNKEKPALDYKVRVEATGRKKEFDNLIDLEIIEVEDWKTKKKVEKLKSTDIPNYFGNMMKVEEFKNGLKKPKKITFFDNIEVAIFCFNSALRNEITDNILEFFALTNFGTRQSKGFGNFYLSKDDKLYKPINETVFDFKTSIKADDVKTLFQKIEWFYKALRSGLNHKRPKKENNKKVYNNGLMEMEDLFYMKPIIFLFYKSKQIQWEKKTIKENYFPRDLKFRDGKLKFIGLETQIQKRKNSDPLVFSSEKKKIIKDVLGFSSEEQWKSYNATIAKKQSELNRDGEIVFKDGIPKDKEKPEIERYKSPLQITPFEIIKGEYIVYFKFNEEDSIQGEWFNINNSKFSGNRPFPLQVVDNFCLEDLFSYVTDEKFQISDHYTLINKGDRQARMIRNTLDELYNNLEKI